MTLYDPPRPDAKQLIAELRDLGVPVKMLTGDALPVAREIGQRVGLPNIRRVAELKAADAQAGNEAVDLLAGADGFAEVYPEDKYIVVQHLQAAGHVTGMTGDGVNDARLRPGRSGHRRQHRNRRGQGRRERRPDRIGVDEHRGDGRAGADNLPTHSDVDHQQDQPTILKAAFVAIAFVVTGRFVVSAFAMLLLVFMTDFAKISLATDHVRPCKKPETWNIGGFIIVSVVLGVAMVAETLLLLWISWSHFGLATNNNALYAFSFLMLLYFAVFSIVSAGTPRVLGDAAQQDLHGGPHGGCADGHPPDVRRSPGTHAIALVADARDICLCHGCVPRRQRRCEGRDDPMAQFLTPWPRNRLI